MNRSGKGGFVKGISGNPGGRPKAIASLTLAARRHALDAIRTLARISKAGKSETARITAAVALLDRGYGRPGQSIEMKLDADLLTRRISDLSLEELAILESKLKALDDDSAQADLFGDDGSVH